jgi:hypothetical protein
MQATENTEKAETAQPIAAAGGSSWNDEKVMMCDGDVC